MLARGKILIIVGGLVTVVIVIALVFDWFDLRKQPEGFEAIQKEQEGEMKTLQKSEVIIPNGPEEIAKTKAKQLAISFVEKFGSFSNQSNFQNLEELKPLMTFGMQSRVDGTIKNGQNQNSGAAGAYYSQVTRAFSAQELSYNEEKGEVEFLVKCQRGETRGNQYSSKTYYQDIKIELQKVGEEWLVDKAEWQ